MRLIFLLTPLFYWEGIFFSDGVENSERTGIRNELPYCYLPISAFFCYVGMRSKEKFRPSSLLRLMPERTCEEAGVLEGHCATET